MTNQINATLIFSDGPDSVSFNTAGPSFVKNKGEELTVRCESTCYPGCSYTWTKQGQTGTVTTIDTLYLSSIQTRHAGNYTCTVRNTYVGITDTKTKTVTLNVRCKFDIAINIVLNYTYQIMNLFMFRIHRMKWSAFKAIIYTILLYFVL